MGNFSGLSNQVLGWCKRNCSANQWAASKTATPAASVGQQKVPSFSPQQHLTTRCTTNTSNVEWIELQSFASAALFTWLITSLLQASQQLFAGKTGSTTSKRQKTFPRVHRILKHIFLCYRNKQNLFLAGKMCWL